MLVSNQPNSSNRLVIDYEKLFTQVSPEEVCKMVSDYVTDERKAKIDRVLSSRTTQVIPVLEKIHDQGNINAVLRTSESLGFQEVHIIESESLKVANRVSQGADKWLDLKTWENTESWLKEAKENNYQICTTSLNATHSLDEIDFSKKSVIVFGNERDGASQSICDHSQVTFKIPMHGFSQSFNISVAAGICLYEISKNLKDRNIPNESELRARYYLSSIHYADKLLRGLLEKRAKH